jgi:hypothetical protein
VVDDPHDLGTDVERPERPRPPAPRATSSSTARVTS